jgi:hypothetical protein
MLPARAAQKGLLVFSLIGIYRQSGQVCKSRVTLGTLFECQTCGQGKTVLQRIALILMEKICMRF